RSRNLNRGDLVQSAAFEDGLLVAGMETKTVEMCGSGVDVQRHLLWLVQTSLLHQEGQGTRFGIFQGPRGFLMIRRERLPLRLLLLAIDLAELDRVNASGIFCLKVDRVITPDYERILISGGQLPLLFASRLKFVGGASECRESPETVQRARELTSDCRIC